MSLGTVFSSEYIEQPVTIEPSIHQRVDSFTTPVSSSSSRLKKKTPTLEENLKTFKKVFNDQTNEAASQLSASVLKVMIQTFKKTPKPSENVRMESNHCLTGEQVRAEMQRKQLAAENE